MRDKLVILVFITFIACFGIGYVVFEQRETSELENRTLQTFPKITPERIISGEFSSDFEDYASDQILFKDSFVRIQVLLTRLSGQALINGVYDGTSGYLIQDYEEPKEQLQDNLSYIRSFNKNHSDEDITFLLIPNVNEIYPEYLPPLAQTYPQADVIQSVKEELGDSCNFVDATDILLAHKEENLYYRNDHHYNAAGAYYTYVALCDSFGIVAKDTSEYQVRQFKQPFYGSLYSKLPISTQTPDDFWFYWHPEKSYDVCYVADGAEGTVSHSLYDETYANKKDLYSIYFGGNHPLITIRERDVTESRPLGKVLVIKDSYANSVVPLLMDECQEIHMVDLRYYHDSVSQYVEDEGFDHIIFIHNVDFLSTDRNYLWL